MELIYYFVDVVFSEILSKISESKSKSSSSGSTQDAWRVLAVGGIMHYLQRIVYALMQKAEGPGNRVIVECQKAEMELIICPKA